MSHDGHLLKTAFELLSFFIPFLFALCFHEFAHGFVARMRGDRTAELMGRLTLNPFAHADPLGTFVLPLLSYFTKVPLFGWAKPVPVDERNLKNPKADMFWIAAAGPLSNLFLALIAAFAYVWFRTNFGDRIAEGDEAIIQVGRMIQMFLGINVFLAVFNLLPIHPLDGGKVVARFLPYNVNRRLEDMQQYSSFLLLAIFLIPGGIMLIAGPAGYVMEALVRFAGGVMGA